MIWMLGGYMWLFVHRPFEVWPILGTLQIERVYVILMFLVWLGAPNKGWVPNRLHYQQAAFTVLLTLSWLISPYMSQKICSESVESYFKVIVFYFLVLTTVRDERGLRMLITMFLAAVGLYMAHSMLEFARGRYEWRMGIRRMLGVDMTYGDPNSFAASLLYTLPLTMPLWATRPSKFLRTLLIGYTLGALACIALTGSRTGFVGLVAMTMMILLVTVKRKGLLLVLAVLAGGIGFALAATVLPDELQQRYLTLVDSSYGPKNAAVSASGRMAGFVAGIEAWQKSPLIGHGPRGFDFATGRMGGAHNLYGQVLSEMGALGALLLLVYVICFALNCLEVRRFYRDHPDEPRDFPFHVARASGIIVVMLLLLGWSGHTLYRYHWQWFAAFQAIAVHCVRKRQQDSQDLWRLDAARAGAEPLTA